MRFSNFDYQELDLLYEALQCKKDEQVMLRKNDRLDQMLKEILELAESKCLLQGSK